MKKCVPFITIWNLELRSKGSNVVFQNVYFLTRKGVKRFLKKHEDELIDCNWNCGGVQLWLR